jgi:hypothetical protein
MTAQSYSGGEIYGTCLNCAVKYSMHI